MYKLPSFTTKSWTTNTRNNVSCNIRRHYCDVKESNIYQIYHMMRILKMLNLPELEKLSPQQRIISDRFKRISSGNRYHVDATNDENEELIEDAIPLILL